MFTYFKKITLIIIVIFFSLPFLTIDSFAETSQDNTSISESELGGREHGGGGSDGNRDDNNSSSSISSFSFTFLGHSYVFNIPSFDGFMPIIRDIVFYSLLAKSVFTKYKALPSIIGQVPFIGSSDFQQISQNSK